MTKIGGIFVRTDDPAYLERQVDPQSETIDLDALDVGSVQAEYRARQRNFSTAPIDPTGQFLRFFPGGFTVWSGYPGHGKTSLLRQLACKLIHDGQNVFVCSLEERPNDVFMRHACTALGTDNPSTDGLQWCADIWAQKLRLWNYHPASDCCRHQQILAATRLLAREHGVRHVIIDSLMCLDIAGNDWEAQRQFSLALAKTADLSGCHVHLVAHPKKPIQSGATADISDVAGSSDLSRRADNVLFVRRSDNEPTTLHGHLRPMVVSVRKQRYGTGYVGDIAGNFHYSLRQFVIDRFQPDPTRYLPDMAYERRIAAEPLT